MSCLRLCSTLQYLHVDVLMYSWNRFVLILFREHSTRDEPTESYLYDGGLGQTQRLLWRSAPAALGNTQMFSAEIDSKFPLHRLSAVCMHIGGFVCMFVYVYVCVCACKHMM